MANTKPTKAEYEALQDPDLIIHCQSGCKMAFEVLVKRHQRTVFALLYQLAPDWKNLNDLSQEVFIRVYRGIVNLRNPKTFKSWLNQIALNLFYDELRKRPRRLPTVSLDQSIEADNGEGEFLREVRDNALLPEERTSYKELNQFIRKAMAELPEQFRTAIVLRELQGLRYEEIAEIVDCELGTVKSRIARARVRLKEILKPYLETIGEEEILEQKYA